MSTILDERKDNSLPDIKGFFLQITSENILDLTIEKDYENLLSIYPKFLISSIVKYYELKPNFDLSQLDIRKENELKRSFLPILNLLEITGLIKIILEFNEEKDTWNYIENYWLKLLKNEDKLINIDYLRLVISLSESSIGVSVGFEQRFNWNLKIKKLLLNKIKKDFFTISYSGIIPTLQEEQIIVHDNVLIREYIGNERYSNDIDGITIFIYSILTKNFEKENLKFEWPRDQKSFLNALKRNKKIYKEYKNAKQKS